MSGLLKTEQESVDGAIVRVARLHPSPENNDRTPAVFLHGYPENLNVWSALLPILCNQRPVLAFDWPGLGGSAALAGGLTPLDMARRLIRLLDHWQLDGVHVVGADMGGQPALVVAAEFPERIRSVVVMNSLVMGDETTSWEIRVLRDYGWNLKILRMLPRLVFWRARRTFVTRGERIPGEILADFWEYFRRRSVRDTIVRMCAGYQGLLKRLPDYYRRIGCSVLALWGQHDKHFPPSQAEALVSLISHGEKRILEGAGHWMMLSRAGDVATELESFWARNEREALPIDGKQVTQTT